MIDVDQPPRHPSGQGWPPHAPVADAAALGPSTGTAASVEESPSLPRWYLTLPRWLRRLAPPLTALGLLVSLFVHVAFLSVAAIWYFGGGGGGSGGGTAQAGGGGAIGVAVMTEQELGQITGGALDESSVAVSEVGSSPVTLGEGELKVETAGLGLSSSLTGGNLGDLTGGLGAGAGAGEIGSGPGTGGGSGGGAASFFGIEARGSRFAYICDISGSMGIGVGGDGSTTRLTVLQNELEKSVRSLQDIAYFHIVLFSARSAPLGDKREWVAASDGAKAWARRAISQIEVQNDTIPMPAFKMVFALRPRPDAIYFMTDGEFPDANVGEIAALNAELKIPIHCITLISDEGQQVMQKIAADSGGSYTHITGPRK